MKIKQLLESTTPKASAAAVKKMYADASGKPRAPWGGWASFKHKLVDMGILKTVDDDCPVEWQEAFKKACGR